MKHYNIYFIIGLAVNIPHLVLGTTQDSLATHIPSKERIESYIQSGSFEYDTTVYGPSLLDKLKYWLREKLGHGLEFLFDAKILHIAVFVMLIMFIVWLILRSQNIDIRSLFRKQKLDIQEIEFIAEDINELDFDKLIEEARQTKNYRIAIRFSFLKTLKTLSDNLIIKWNPNKTNYDYQYEIEDHNIRKKFLESSYIFDYVWYGQFEINEQHFEEVYSFFYEFNMTIANEK